MLTIGKLAKKYGLSRSTLLYYDSIGLLSPELHQKGDYRYYTPADEQRLQLICSYRQAGIPLKDIQQILDSANSDFTAILEQRFTDINEEIKHLYDQQKIIAGLLQNTAKISETGVMTRELWSSLLECAGFTEEDMRNWHARFEQANPKMHQLFLEHLHISEDEILQIRKWSLSNLQPGKS